MGQGCWKWAEQESVGCYEAGQVQSLELGLTGAGWLARGPRVLPAVPMTTTSPLLLLTLFFLPMVDCPSPSWLPIQISTWHFLQEALSDCPSLPTQRSHPSVGCWGLGLELRG